MFYIDDYNSKAITNGPPKKSDKIAISNAKKQMEARQLAIFWHLAGITIVSDFAEVKGLLNKYGYKVSNEKDAALAITDMIGTAKWANFVKEFGEIMEEAVDEKIVDQINSGGEESAWVQALIAAVGSVASSSLNVAASAKAQEAAKENAKGQMFTGISAMLTEKERTKAEAERTKQSSKKGIIWIVLAIIIVLGIIIGIVIYKKRQATVAITK